MPGKPEQIAKIKSDLEKLPVNDDRLFLESALYLFEDAIFDSTWCLYKIMKHKKTTTDPILAKYYEFMVDKYQLNTVNFD